MKKINPIKKGKGIFIYDIKSNRFYDLQYNSNILGHSYKKLTTITKNHISSSWNLSNDTIYHHRLIKLIEKLFTDNYYLTSTFSLIEFFSRFLNYLNHEGYKIEIIGEKFNLWFNKYNMNNSKNDKIISVYDMAELYLKSRNNPDNYYKSLNNIKDNKLRILNYFWHPDTDIKTLDSDLIILPELYSGNFNYINILIKKDSILFKNHKYFSNNISKIPSLYIASSLKEYYLINKLFKDNFIKLNWNNFIQTGRIFSYDNIKESEYCKITERLFTNNIILNNEPPYYNYLPIILEDYQKKYLLSIKL